VHNLNWQAAVQVPTQHHDSDGGVCKHIAPTGYYQHSTLVSLLRKPLQLLFFVPACSKGVHDDARCKQGASAALPQHELGLAAPGRHGLRAPSIFWSSADMMFAQDTGPLLVLVLPLL
jgi:hypothetical protein